MKLDGARPIPPGPRGEEARQIERARHPRPRCRRLEYPSVGVMTTICSAEAEAVRLARRASPAAPLTAQPTLQESAPFYGADAWPGNRRLRLRLPPQPTLQESAPFYGADALAFAGRAVRPGRAAANLRGWAP